MTKEELTNRLNSVAAEISQYSNILRKESSGCGTWIIADKLDSLHEEIRNKVNFIQSNNFKIK